MDEIDCKRSKSRLYRYFVNHCDIKGIRNIHSSRGHEIQEIEKYRFIRIVKMDPNLESIPCQDPNSYDVIEPDRSSVIYEYKQLCSNPIGNIFFIQNDVPWFLGSREYCSQLFVNLESRQAYHNCFYPEINRDNGDILPEAEGNHSMENDDFIWIRSQFNALGTLVIVYGCYWAGLDEIRVYDLSNIIATGKWSKLEINFSYAAEYFDKALFSDENPHIIVTMKGENVFQKFEFQEENNQLALIETSEFAINSMNLHQETVNS